MSWMFLEPYHVTFGACWEPAEIATEWEIHSLHLLLSLEYAYSDIPEKAELALPSEST